MITTRPVTASHISSLLAKPFQNLPFQLVSKPTGILPNRLDFHELCLNGAEMTVSITPRVSEQERPIFNVHLTSPIGTRDITVQDTPAIWAIVMHEPCVVMPVVCHSSDRLIRRAGVLHYTAGFDPRAADAFINRIIEPAEDLQAFVRIIGNASRSDEECLKATSRNISEALESSRIPYSRHWDAIHSAPLFFDDQGTLVSDLGENIRNITERRSYPQSNCYSRWTVFGLSEEDFIVASLHLTESRTVKYMPVPRKAFLFTSTRGTFRFDYSGETQDDLTTTVGLIEASVPKESTL